MALKTHKRDSASERYALFFAAGAIAAHGQGDSIGFRQRDFKFLMELFSNWLEVIFPDKSLSLQNTQVSRYLDNLTTTSYAKRFLRDGKKFYRLTRNGLWELLKLIASKDYIDSKECFFFLYYFVANYKNTIEQLLQDEANQFPYHLKTEISKLLDEKQLLKNELTTAKSQVQRLEQRILEAKSSGQLAQKLIHQGTEEDEVMRTIEKKHPYGLNSQKPLSELLLSLPKEVQRWELEYGYHQRVEQIFKPMKEILSAYIRALERLGELA